MIETSTASRQQQRLAPTRGVPSFSRLRSAHLVGICGAGMKALAEFLEASGVTVTGSDAQESHPVIEAMQQRGLRVHGGHRDAFLPTDADVLVHSVAVGPDNAERKLAASRGVPQLSYSEMLGRIATGRNGIGVAGTHGKSTTTAMVATILGEAGREPSAIIGAELCGLGTSGWAGTGDDLVVEACEYRRSFLDIPVRHATILGVESDHFDYFADLDDLSAAFGEFASRVDAKGRLVVRGGCPLARVAATKATAEVVTFGTEPGADWWITDPRPGLEGTWYRVFQRGGFFGDVLLRVPGTHNALNAVAAIALCDGLGVDKPAISNALAEFPGIKRRFETVASWRGITIVDDYAHHPTEVAATLQAARQRFGARRVWCAFQPHQVSRLRELMPQFAGSFGEADRVLVAPVFAAREKVGDESLAASGELAERLVRAGVVARPCTSLDQIVATIDDEAAPGDVLITMGAGDVDLVHHEFARRLR